MDIDRIFSREISAILPTYGNQGDICTIYTADGEIISLPLKLKTVLRKIAKHHTIDLYSLKCNAGKVTSSVLWQPLVLTNDLLLVPLKTRSPVVTGDSTGGLFNLHRIEQICRHDHWSTLIKLTGNHKIIVLWRQITVEQHLRRARYLSLLAAAQKPHWFDRLTRELAQQLFLELRTLQQ